MWFGEFFWGELAGRVSMRWSGAGKLSGQMNGVDCPWIDVGSAVVKELRASRRPMLFLSFVVVAASLCPRTARMKSYRVIV